MNPGDSVSVERYEGIAFRFDGHPIIYDEPTWELTCELPEDDDHTHDSDRCGYWSFDEDGQEDEDRAVCHMVGDNHKFNFDINRLTPLADEDFCGECGQIGCCHDGKERD